MNEGVSGCGNRGEYEHLVRIEDALSGEVLSVEDRCQRMLGLEEVGVVTGLC